VHQHTASVHENVILTSDKASREGSLPLTDPALTTDDTEMAEPLQKSQNSDALQCALVQRWNLYVPSLLRSSAFCDWVKKSTEWVSPQVSPCRFVSGEMT